MRRGIYFLSGSPHILGAPKAAKLECGASGRGRDLHFPGRLRERKRLRPMWREKRTKREREKEQDTHTERDKDREKERALSCAQKEIAVISTIRDASLMSAGPKCGADRSAAAAAAEPPSAIVGAALTRVKSGNWPPPRSSITRPKRPICSLSLASRRQFNRFTLGVIKDGDSEEDGSNPKNK